MSWRCGLHVELCQCFECHDPSCERTLFLYPSKIGRVLCALLGHKLGDEGRVFFADGGQRLHIYACIRRCGFVYQEDLPHARLIRER